MRSTAKQGYQQGHSHKITDWEKFRAFAATPGDQTQAEMAQWWPEAIREDTIGRALKRIGCTRKSGATPPASVSGAIASRSLIRSPWIVETAF